MLDHPEIQHLSTPLPGYQEGLARFGLDQFLPGEFFLVEFPAAGWARLLSDLPEGEPRA